MKTDMKLRWGRAICESIAVVQMDYQTKAKTSCIVVAGEVATRLQRIVTARTNSENDNDYTNKDNTSPWTDAIATTVVLVLSIMPKYHARSTSVSLLVSPLADSTGDIEPRRSVSATKKAEAAERALEAGYRLHEAGIDANGEPGRVSFLLRSGAPFLIVEARTQPATKSTWRTNATTAVDSIKIPSRSKELSHPSVSSISTLTSLGSGKTSPSVQGPLKQRATSAFSTDSLSTLSTLSSRLFSRSMSNGSVLAASDQGREDEANKHQTLSRMERRESSTALNSQRRLSYAASPVPYTPALPQALTVLVNLSSKSFVPSFSGLDPRKLQDVKIEVFLNGEFAGCSFVPGRFATESPHHKPMLSGSRCDKVVEKPWIYVPHGQNADGSLRSAKRGKSGSVKDRWEQVSSALASQSAAIVTTRGGMPSAVTEYLHDLSNLQMPEGLQDFSTRRFGVVDVVLSLGSGYKGQSSACLDGCKRYKDVPTAEERHAFEKERFDTAAPMSTPREKDKAKLQYEMPSSEVDAEGETDIEYSVEEPRSLGRHRPQIHSPTDYTEVPEPGEGRHSEMRCQYRTRKRDRDCQDEDAEVSDPPSKQKRARYADGARVFLATASVSTPSLREDAQCRTKAGNMNASAHSGSSAHTSAKASPNIPLAATKAKGSRRDSILESAQRKEVPKEKRGVVAVLPAFDEWLEESFEVPELSEGSAITYAKKGPWTISNASNLDGKRRSAGCDMPGRKSIMRQVRTEREGSFKDDSILLGVRFLVA